MNDEHGEFFIKINENLGNGKSSKEQWLKSFVFRTMTVNEFAVNPQVEVSAPLFLRPVITDILNVGKSVKIVKLFDKQENHQFNPKR